MKKKIKETILDFLFKLLVLLCIFIVFNKNISILVKLISLDVTAIISNIKDRKYYKVSKDTPINIVIDWYGLNSMIIILTIGIIIYVIKYY